jgi:predicted TIM-barrel fold metal-dependent hydrolase
MTRYKVLSADSHLDLLPERWTDRVPDRWRDRAPRSVKLASGSDAIIIENRAPMSPGLALTGKPFEQHDPTFVDWEHSPGTGSAEQRAREQDMDGVEAEVLFTHPSYPNHWRGIREDEPYKAMIHAYNSYLAEEYAPAAPGRLFPMGVIPDTGVDDAIEEMQHCARIGMKGVNLYAFPNGKGFPAPEDDRFWTAALAMNMPVTSHTVGGSTRFRADGPAFQYAKAPRGGNDNRRDPVSLMVRFASENAMTPLQMAFAGVFDRFPTLRVYWAETQIGWLPYCLSQVDDNWERNRYWAERFWGLEPPARPPSHYLKNQCLWGFMNDPFGIEMRDRIGVQNILWGSDFAHAAGDWPHSLEVIDETFVGVSADERDRLLSRNAVEFFRIEEDA